MSYFKVESDLAFMLYTMAAHARACTNLLNDDELYATSKAWPCMRVRCNSHTTLNAPNSAAKLDIALLRQGSRKDYNHPCLGCERRPVLIVKGVIWFTLKSCLRCFSQGDSNKCGMAFDESDPPPLGLDRPWQAIITMSNPWSEAHCHPRK